MKVLLTHGYFLHEDPKEQQIMRPYVPLGILYIAAFLEQNGFPNTVFDATFQRFETLTERLLSERPDVVAIYTNLMTKINVLRMITLIREEPALRKTKIILGGPEVRNHAQNFLLYGADIIVFGEGEQTMLEMVQTIRDGGRLEDVAGIAFQQDQQIITTAERSLNKAIDELPAPARNKIDLQSYLDVWKQRHGYSSVNISTMRGCPYTCRWCSRAVYGQSYRRRSAQVVVDEIVSLQQSYQFDNLWFVDDVFTVSHKWLQSFHDELKSRNVVVRYECISRADRLNEDVVKLLRDTGCFRVWIGAESGSQKIIDAMDRRVDVQQTREMIKLVQRYGMEAGTFIMLGYPGETQEDIEETVHHLKASLPDQFTITLTYPIKGTPLYAETEQDFLAQLPWHESTDRDIDFKRTYPRKYYDHAISWVMNEVNATRMLRMGRYPSALKLKLASLKNKLQMQRSKLA